MDTHGRLPMAGALGLKVIRSGRRIGWSWRLRNAARWSFVKGWIAAHLVAPLANWWGVTTVIGELAIRVRRVDADARAVYHAMRERGAPPGEIESYLSLHGQWIDYGTVGYRVVTDAGVAFIVDDWDNSGTDMTTLNFHGIGTGSTAEAAGDTALVTESTTALNPDSTRATGTRSQPAANQYRSVGTLTADAQIVVREHGLFSASATGTGTLWDRTVFATITLESADSLQSTYTATLSSGG